MRESFFLDTWRIPTRLDEEPNLLMDEMPSPEVQEIFNRYPAYMREKLLELRLLILETAQEIEDLDVLEETLKWGEPSYVTKGGSTIRVGWKKSKPDRYAINFHCKTKLVDTFKVLYPNIFEFEGNRAIVFHENEELPVLELKHCIKMSLRYHKIKHLPLLGA